MKKSTLFLFITFIFLLSSCNEKTITLTDNGKTLIMKQGDVLKVQLRGSISTGNKWIIKQIDKNALKEIKKHTYKADNDKIGAAGLYTYYFKILKKGKFQLNMTYSPQYSNKKPLKTFTILIDAK